jgi:hypothetical protein
MDKNLCRRTTPPPTHRPSVEKLRAELRGYVVGHKRGKIATEP